MELSEKEILIHHNNSIIDLQIAFNARYPFLKIDFIGTVVQDKPVKIDVVNKQVATKPSATADGLCEINISSYRTVVEVLNDVEQIFGVMGELSRKSGNVWNKVSITEGWTLENQNAAAEFITLEMARHEK